MDQTFGSEGTGNNKLQSFGTGTPLEDDHLNNQEGGGRVTLRRL
jgi:hypothetical protein